MSACAPIDFDRCRRNLYRSVELFRACCELKEAWLRAQHPHMPARAIRRRVLEDILAAKEAAWKRQSAQHNSAERKSDSEEVRSKDVLLS